MPNSSTISEGRVAGDSWLTPKRLRVHGLLLAIALWSVYIWTIATPGLRDRNGNLKGTDFLHFYTLGLVASEHRAESLYDMHAQSVIAAKHIPAAAGIKYLPLYPPQVSLIFEPLSRLSYTWALAAWWIFTAALYGVCCFVVWKTCPRLRTHAITVAVLALAFPAFFHLIAWGQTSALALTCFTGMYFALRKRQEFLAGMVLGLLIFKPQLALGSVIVFAVLGCWRTLVAAALSATGELWIGAAYYGPAAARDWVHTLWQALGNPALLEPRMYQTHSLRSFWGMMIPWHAAAWVLYGVCAALALATTIAIWRQKPESLLGLRYSALLLATVLIAPHLTVYDLVILAPAILLLSDWLIDRVDASNTQPIGTFIYFVYALPLLGPLARWTHVQLSVIAMSCLLWMLWRATRPRSFRSA